MFNKIVSNSLFFLLLTIAVNLYSQDNTQVGLPEGAIARLGKGGINTMQFSPDGSLLAVGTDVGVWLYDVSSGRDMALFTGYTGRIDTLDFSPDGNMLASGGFVNPIIQIWDPHTGNKLRAIELAERKDRITSLSFSEDGKTLTSIDLFGTITHHDLFNRTQETLDVSSGPHGVLSVFSRDGSTIASENEGKIFLWNSVSGKQQAIYKGHSSRLKGDSFINTAISEIFKTPMYAEITSFDFSPNWKLLVSGSLDRTVQLWDIIDGHKIATFKGHRDTIGTVAFSSDGKTVASGDSEKSIKLWDVNTKRERVTLSGHSHGISALVFSPDDKTLASGSEDGTIRFWNSHTGEEISIFASGHVESVNSIAFNKNGSSLVSASSYGSVDIWSIKTARELSTVTTCQTKTKSTTAFSPDGTLFASYGKTYTDDSLGRIRLLNVTTGDELLGPWNKINISVVELLFTHENRFLYANTSKGIRCWDILAGKEYFPFGLEPAQGRILTIAPNGKHIAMETFHGLLRVWDIDRQIDLNILSDRQITGLAFSPDSMYLVQSHYNDGLILWELTPTELKEDHVYLEKLRGFNPILTFSPDGSTLVGSEDMWYNQIKILDVDTGKIYTPLTGHTEDITAFAFSQDGMILASASKDGSILLWDWNKMINNGDL